MFLTELDTDEKKYFLELSFHGMEANEQLKDSEMKIFTNFKYECTLPEYEVKKINLDEILSFFMKSKKHIQKIVVIELLGIFLADGKICDKEELLLDKITNKWNLSNAQVRRMRRWVMDCNDMLADAYRLIGVEE